MRRMELRITCFLIQSAWQIGGTVVPPRVFHWCSTLIGSASRSWLYACPRIACAGAPGHVYAKKDIPSMHLDVLHLEITQELQTPTSLRSNFHVDRQKSTF